MKKGAKIIVSQNTNIGVLEVRGKRKLVFMFVDPQSHTSFIFSVAHVGDSICRGYQSYQKIFSMDDAIFGVMIFLDGCCQQKPHSPKFIVEPENDTVDGRNPAPVETGRTITM